MRPKSIKGSKRKTYQFNQKIAGRKVQSEFNSFRAGKSMHNWKKFQTCKTKLQPTWLHPIRHCSHSQSYRTSPQEDMCRHYKPSVPQCRVIESKIPRSDLEAAVYRPAYIQGWNLCHQSLWLHWMASYPEFLLRQSEREKNKFILIFPVYILELQEHNIKPPAEEVYVERETQRIIDYGNFTWKSNPLLKACSTLTHPSTNELDVCFCG